MAGNAHAHLVTTGMGPVYDGIGHLLLTPEDFVPAVAISLFCGLRGAGAGRYALFIVPISWFWGGVCGGVFSGAPSLPLPIVSFVLLGVLIATDTRLPDLAIMLMIGGLSFMHGGMNGLVLREGPGLLGLCGISVALFVLLSLVSAIVVSLNKNWQRIVIRVFGSWIAASGLLLMGWQFGPEFP